jgi:hypothetical protein
MNIVTCDRTIARETRLRLCAEHLERCKRGEPQTHLLPECPGV